MYDVVLADPPWKFESWTAKGTGRSAEQHYPVMRLSDIQEMILPAKENCALFLWACWPMLIDALDTIESWDFEYRTIGWVWVKAKKNSKDLRPTFLLSTEAIRRHFEHIYTKLIEPAYKTMKRQIGFKDPDKIILFLCLINAYNRMALTVSKSERR